MGAADGARQAGDRACGLRSISAKGGRYGVAERGVQEVKIAVRLGIAPCTGAEEIVRDIGVPFRIDAASGME